MTGQYWFSAMLRMVVLVEGMGGSRRVRTVVLLRAADWSEAKERAFQRGLDAERSYAGGAGEQVRSRSKPSIFLARKWVMGERCTRNPWT
jgi:hypothetical protein